MNVVLVEDNEELSSLIVEQLSDKGIKVDQAFSGEEALDVIDVEAHDLVILDRGLPDMEGLELLTILRDEGVKLPVLVLTAKDGLGDKVQGLNSGADDYLVKPFDVEELIARIFALNRRPNDTTKTVFTVGNLSFSPAESLIRAGETILTLSAKEQQALERLMRLPGRVLSKDTLLTALYGNNEEGSHNSVEVILHRLRKKLDQAGSTAKIKTLRGIGYVIKQDSEEAA